MQWQAEIDPPWQFAPWRDAARAALRAGVPPEALGFQTREHPGLLPAPDVRDAAPVHAPPRVPKAYVALAETVLCHRDNERHALLYRMLWRICHGEPALLSTPLDADVSRANALAQQVRRDTHKMKAFVRFREVPGTENTFIAWFQPEHFILERVAPFFARRFTGMRWSILTPVQSAHWDGSALRFGPGGQRSDAPAEDAGEAMWKTYYAHIFNPARLNLRMMQQEMPKRYWKHLPEAGLIADLARDAGRRVEDMVAREAQDARRRIPVNPMRAAPVDDSLPAVAEAARACRACPLWAPATQTVFGEGPADARVVFVGEQPGDREDLSGRPFVGPAGKLLDRALAEAGIDRGRVYLTNAVKHFRFERDGKARLHRNPEKEHIEACRPWLARELSLIRPELVVTLGATAARAVLGPAFRLIEAHGKPVLDDTGRMVLPTVHPAWVLRQPTGEARDNAWSLWLRDLGAITRIVKGFSM